MINAETDLYAIFGRPVGHSKSPVIHNASFQSFGINAVYLAFETDEIKKGMDAVRSLNIRGASVTIPFKEDVMAYIDEIDPEAEQIGAVNTVHHKDGRLTGYNTDSKAAINPLNPDDIAGKQVCVIGAGGAAHAVAYGIAKQGGNLLIVNRNKDRGRNLASKYNASFIAQDRLVRMDKLDADIVINTTSVGMAPDSDATPLPGHLLNPEMIVMDVVYTPLNTRLLADARATGCKTVDGLSMFIHQGAAQFKIWTGKDPDLEIMRNALLNEDRYNEER